MSKTTSKSLFARSIHLLLGMAAALVCLAVNTGTAREFFAAPNGKETNEGSEDSPWDLRSALTQTKTIQPGDTLWLRGGMYRGEFQCQLAGRPEMPVTIRQYPGERATVDLAANGRTSTFVVRGNWVRLWGFEVTCTDPTRETEITGSFPSDIQRGSIDCRASHVEFINLIVHDLAVGFGFWSEGEGGEIYGCLIYNNGWKAPDRGHGHGIYTQNARGVKRLTDNILFNQFSHGIHAYGSSKAHLDGFHIEGNIAFNNGVLSGPEHVAPNILVGGGVAATNIRVERNFTYHSNPGTSLRLGYAALNEDLELRHNYLAGLSDIKHWKKVTANGNTLVGANGILRLDVPKGTELASYLWEGNSYRSTQQKYAPLVAVQDGASVASNWEEWTKAGMDRGGEYSAAALTGVDVFVRPNRYEAGRAHIAVYNWSKRDMVDVNLSNVLKVNQHFRVLRAQQYFGNPALVGVFDGNLVQLPMNPVEPSRPIGLPDFRIPSTAPEFEAFVVIPE